ncbi:MAG: wax ester/triacylglycerol synthase family O-acyltransferase [Gammaproteobacteria bacterium]|nr:wax ester/triacylglycerol synthase family O-acyltransferase [Gammaproteobacteria bacterium]
MRRMPITDAFFLLAESRRTPMHVGGLNLFTLPKDVDDTTFLANLGNILRNDGDLRRPFGEKLKTGPLGVAGNIYWEEEDDMDMEYHVRHSALPRPGRYRELFALISRLHSTLLDRSRPLWEMHLIEGLPNRQFATYFKAHHCAIDGVGSMHLMSSMYSTNARNKVKVSPLSREAYELYKQQLAATSAPRAKPQEAEVKAVLDVLKGQLGGTVNVARVLRESANVWLGRNTTLAVPFHNIPKSAVSTQITGARRFVAQSWPFARVRAMGRAYDGTLNDAVMAMCAGALRKHLQEQRDLPKMSLKAMAPVSLRAAGDVDSANAVGMVIADLGTNVRDPATRFRTIKESMDAAKAQLQQLSPGEIQAYTGISQAPLLLTQLTGLSSRFPAFSTVISNVPGPREKRYWNGARLDGMYPVSIPMDGAAVNFTLVSNNENLDFGIVACRKSVPHLQRLIDYMEESLVELEDAAGLRRRRPAARKSAPQVKKSTRAASRAKARPKLAGTRK